MLINRYVRAILFCIAYLIIGVLLLSVVRCWFPVLLEDKISRNALCILPALICVVLERIFYEFDPFAHGDVRLKSRKK